MGAAGKAGICGWLLRSFSDAQFNRSSGPFGNSNPGKVTGAKAQ